ncbi:hypothetical protein HDU86_003600 [Geranomyces michiganensis]|nr:hypothetical protein HDU86_003600 [Geranomyces michiganensis]
MAAVFPTAKVADDSGDTTSPLTTYERWHLGGEETEVLLIPRETGRPCRAVVVMIPGNPGLIQYYESFLQKLHEECDGLDIVGAQHLGHSFAVATRKTFSISDQIAHKLSLIEEVEKQWGRTTPIVLIGHSFGCYVNVQIMKARPDANVVKIVQLFPTLHSMAITPQGKIISWAALPLVREIPALMISFLRVLLPTAPLFRSLVARFTTNQSSRDLDVTINNLLHFRTVRNTLYLAHDEMRTITTWRPEDLKHIIGRCTFYYGTTDHWVPLHHAAMMTETFPEADVHVCRDDLPHAFVMGYADVMAIKAAQWINPAIGM